MSKFGPQIAALSFTSFHSMKLRRFDRVISLLVISLACAGSTPLVNALTFNFIPAAGTSASAIAGFQAAGARWSGLFSDPVTINIDIAFQNLAGGILAQAGSTSDFYSYGSLKAAMLADQSSSADATAVSYLPGSSVPLFINHTADNGNSATPYLDNNNSANNNFLDINNANAKALGLMSASNAASDADIAFSSAYTWDFDPTNGITAGAFDFVGVAAHEIGHALGFVSGVDILDYNTPPGGFDWDVLPYLSTLDLFRYSAGSTAVGAVDWTADTRTKYFSLDGGVTNTGVTFSTGSYNGDGRQASHWKDNLGLGIMDPTGAPGETLIISANDITAFDVIGWDRADASGVPDTTPTLALLALGVALIGRLRRRVTERS